MSAPYRELLQRIRTAFPQPVSDRIHDSYFVHSIMRALDQVDALKSELPLLGGNGSADYEAARRADLRPNLASLEEVTSELVGYLEGMPIFGHPRTQQNVITQPSIPSLIGVLLASLYNPNLAWDEYSHRVALAEVEAATVTARLVGYDPERSAGVFTFGGTGTTLYGVKIGLEKACPGTMHKGVHTDALLFASDASHYCRYNVAGWLGMGTANIVTVPTRATGEIDLAELERAARAALDAGKRIAAFVATMGSTDSFGLDDLETIIALRDQLVRDYDLPYRPHVHADAVIGWAWSVFNDYSWEENRLGFRPRTVRALAGACRRLRHLHLADSLGVDFHKTGFAPYISSLVLVKDRADLQLLSRVPEQMPYMYNFGTYAPGLFTLETSRAGTGVLAALANLRLFGRDGLQALLGHIVEMAQVLREHLEGHVATTVLNRDNFGPVTLFRVYPARVDTFAIKGQEFEDARFRDALLRHNEYNRRVFRYVHDEALAGRGVMISLTDCYRHTSYGEPIVALKSYILSPFVDEEHVEAVVRKVLEARAHVEAEPG
jgi:glutamate/tyrosine decarboxylase-like PLP-dependent enzyme